MAKPPHQQTLEQIIANTAAAQSRAAALAHIERRQKSLFDAAAHNKPGNRSVEKSDPETYREAPIADYGDPPTLEETSARPPLQTRKATTAEKSERKPSKGGKPKLIVDNDKKPSK